MARPALPRFVRVGDSFDASVVVSSKELADAEVSVTIAARGLTLTGESTQGAALQEWQRRGSLSRVGQDAGRGRG